jgi:NADPH-dependent curcumin reductase CurA
MLRGATAVGLAGSDEKCRRVVEEIGFAACINYKSDDYPDMLRAALPDGADVYHDNVGGQMLIDAIGEMNDYGTVVLCGLISQYNDASAAVNLPVALAIMKRLVMKGLVVYDYNDQQQEFIDMVAPWVHDGSITIIEDRATDITSTGGHFARLMRGENIGKSLVVLGPENSQTP